MSKQHPDRHSPWCRNNTTALTTSAQVSKQHLDLLVLGVSEQHPENVIAEVSKQHLCSRDVEAVPASLRPRICLPPSAYPLALRYGERSSVASLQSLVPRSRGRAVAGPSCSAWACWAQSCAAAVAAEEGGDPVGDHLH